MRASLAGVSVQRARFKAQLMLAPPAGASPVTTSCSVACGRAVAVDPQAVLDREPPPRQRNCHGRALGRAQQRAHAVGGRRHLDAGPRWKRIAKGTASASCGALSAGSSMSSPRSSRPSRRGELAAVDEAEARGHSRHGSPRSGCRAFSSRAPARPRRRRGRACRRRGSRSNCCRRGSASNAPRWCAGRRRAPPAAARARRRAAAIDDEPLRPVATSRTPASRRSRPRAAARPAAARRRRPTHRARPRDSR